MNAAVQGGWLPGRVVSAYRPARRIQSLEQHIAFCAGVLASQREEWMVSAREAKNTGLARGVVATCVQAARNRNHDLIARLRDLRKAVQS